MPYLHNINSDHLSKTIQEKIPNPFDHRPVAIALVAAESLQHRLVQQLNLLENTSGRLFGILVIKKQDGNLAYLSACNSPLGISNQLQFFVPEVFNQLIDFSDIANANTNTNKDENHVILKNFINQSSPLKQLINSNIRLLSPTKCTALNLFHYAAQNNLTPIAFTQFWWGCSPSDTLHRHSYYYPAMNNRYKNALNFLVDGISPPCPDYSSSAMNDSNQQTPKILYEDDLLLAINKPSGVLSTAGKSNAISASEIIGKYLSTSSVESIVIHRLDQATSGILLFAKNRQTQNHMQHQFSSHLIEKKYLAMIHNERGFKQDQTGEINLPIRPDVDDRPRQMVCDKYGKKSTTHWKVVIADATQAKIQLVPVTGRTHQLRVHAAHPSGLNTPIIGDTLYGKAEKRLLLHAETLSFLHPKNDKNIVIQCPADF